MSVLGAVAVEFSDLLKAAARKHKLTGWRIHPVVIHGDENNPNSLLYVKPLKANESPLEAYQLSPPTGDITFIQIKVPKRPLRFVRLKLIAEDKITIKLSYWQGHGWKQNEPPIMSHLQASRHRETPEGYYSYKLRRIHRARRVRGGKLAAIREEDHFDLSLPDSPSHIAELAIRVLNKSFVRHGGMSKSGDNMRLMVDLDGDNFELDEWRTRW